MRTKFIHDFAQIVQRLNALVVQHRHGRSPPRVERIERAIDVERAD